MCASLFDIEQTENKNPFRNLLTLKKNLLADTCNVRARNDAS